MCVCVVTSPMMLLVASIQDKQLLQEGAQGGGGSSSAVLHSLTQALKIYVFLIYLLNAVLIFMLE